MMNRRSFLKRLPACGLIVPAFSHAQPLTPNDPAWSKPESAAAAGCDTLRDSQTGATNTSFDFGDSISSHRWVAQRVTAGASYDCCKIEMLLRKIGTPTNNFRVGLYSHNAIDNFPDSLIGSQSDWVAVVDLPVSEALLSYLVTAPGVTSGQVYWAVIETDAGQTAGNNGQWMAWNPGVGNGRVTMSIDGSTWQSYSNNRSCIFHLYSV